MKRLLLVLALMALSAAATYLIVTRQMAEDRASRLAKALLDAESRMIQLEGDIGSLESRLAGLTDRKGTQAPPVHPAVRTGSAPSSTNATTDGNHLAAALPLPTSVPPARSSLGQTVAFDRFVPVMGSGATNFVRIEGTSSIHAWQAQSKIVGGMLEMESLFGKTFTDEDFDGRAIKAKANCFIPVRSLASVQEDGSPYSSAMDEIMYKHLKADTFNRLTYSLTSLKLKKRSAERAGAFVCEAQGTLAVAGKTNEVIMPVTATPLTDRRLQFTGSIKLKMTDFDITPPAPALAGGAIKTGDEVALRFVWTVERR